MDFPDKLLYTLQHEWLLIKDEVATIGVTDHAQEALGDIVYLGDFPEPEDAVDREDVIGVVESVKATSDIFSPVTGVIVEVNEELDDAPELVNESPYEDGWIIKIKMTEPDEMEDMLNAEAYIKYLAEES